MKKSGDILMAVPPLGSKIAQRTKKKPIFRRFFPFFQNCMQSTWNASTIDCFLGQTGCGLFMKGQHEIQGTPSLTFNSIWNERKENCLD